MTDEKGSVLIELEDDAQPDGLTPANAPPVPDAYPTGQAMQIVARASARPPSRLGRLFWSSLSALLVFILTLAFTNFVTGLFSTSPLLGWIALGLFGLLVLSALAIGFREWMGYRRLARLDDLRSEAEAALASGSLVAARDLADRLSKQYSNRPEMEDARERMAGHVAEAFDADAVFYVAESELLTPLDQAAQAEVAAATRQVAAATALVPLALADVAVAFAANLRMIRRIAEVYGGRAGTLGSWRLTKSVMTHLVATGAVAVGDDLIGSMAGGGVLSKVSRRFGEGVVNGALTARVGVATMEVCRPLPFSKDTRPSVTSLVKRALTGLFSQDK